MPETLKSTRKLQPVGLKPRNRVDGYRHFRDLSQPLCGHLALFFPAYTYIIRYPTLNVNVKFLARVGHGGIY